RCARILSIERGKFTRPSSSRRALRGGALVRSKASIAGLASGAFHAAFQCGALDAVSLAVLAVTAVVTAHWMPARRTLRDLNFFHFCCFSVVLENRPFRSNA